MQNHKADLIEVSSFWLWIILKQFNPLFSLLSKFNLFYFPFLVMRSLHTSTLFKPLKHLLGLRLGHALSYVWSCLLCPCQKHRQQRSLFSVCCLSRCEWTGERNNISHANQQVKCSSLRWIHTTQNHTGGGCHRLPQKNICLAYVLVPHICLTVT